MLLVHLCIKFIASHLDACPRAALEQLPVELRAAVLGHLLRSMKLGEVDFSALVGKEGQTPVIEALDLSASPYEEAGGPTAQLLRHIGACAPLLKDLRLKNCKVLNDALVQVLLEALPHLEALHLSGAMNVTDKALLNIKDKVGSQLKRLELNTPNKITAPALNQLLISTPNLRSLSINSAAALRDEIIGVVADDCRELLNLEIKNDPRLTDKATEYIARGTDGQGGLHKLKSLTLGCYHLTGAHLDVLAASCTQLERLAFPNACFKEPSTRCPRLEALSVCIDACSEGVFQTFRDVASGLCELVMAAHAKPASVMGSTIQFEDAKCIVEGCPRLQKLKLYNVDIEVLPLALRDLPDLQGLDLSFVEDHLAEEESAAELIEAEREALEARRSIRKEHATGSVPIASSSLRRLHLTDLPTHDVLTAEAMANIARSSPKLEVLKLALASIDTDPVLFALSAARPALRKVQLFGCANATDRGVVALIRSSGHKITGLDLRELPGIGDESLVAIFRHCGHLRSLFLAQRSQATVPTIARLQKEHPHVNVYHF